MDDHGLKKEVVPTRAVRICRRYWVPIALVVLAIALRSPGIFRPLLGNFATRNVVSGMVARNWIEGRTSLWYPATDCVPRVATPQKGESTLDVESVFSLQGTEVPYYQRGRRALIMLEFPVATYLTAIVHRAVGGSLDAWGRGMSIAFSAASVLLLYWLARGWHNGRVAAASAAAFSLSPVSIVHGQSFTLEASAVCFQLAALVSFDRWLATRRSRWLAAGGLTLALLLLTKIYMLVTLLPLAGLLWLTLQLRNTSGGVPLVARRVSEGATPIDRCPRLRVGSYGVLGRFSRESFLRTLRSFTISAWPALFTIALACLPAAVWCWHVFETARFDNPLSSQLFYSFRQSAQVHAFPHPLLFSPEFYAQLVKDLATVALTPIGVILALAGAATCGTRRHAAWLLACAALVAGLPLKFFELNYYWLTILPPLCLLVGLGWDWIASRWRPRQWAIGAVCTIALLFSLRYSIRPAFVTPVEDCSVVAAGLAVQSLAGPDEPVVTMHGSCIDLLYYCNRAGWAISPRQKPERLASRLAECRRQGARLIVVAGREQFVQHAGSRALIEELPLVVCKEDYEIRRLGPISPDAYAKAK